MLRKALLLTLLLTLLTILLAGCATTGPKRELETVFYPPLPQQPRLQYLTSITSEQDLGKRQSGMQAFLLGDQPTNRLGRPHAVGIRSGRLYVSDLALGQVLIVDFAKKEIKPFNPGREGTMQTPMGLTVAADGLLYVADSDRRQILAFDQEDRFVRAYGSRETLVRPLDVAVHENRIYVADFPEHNVKVFDRESGDLLETIGGRGTAEGEMDRPTHVRVDRHGNLYVNDSFNFRIQKFDVDGAYLHHFGYLGQTLGGFARPKGFDLSRVGHLYAADAGFENVQIFNDENQHLLLFFGGFGQGQGYMYLPSAVAIDYENVEFFRKYQDNDFKIEYLVYVSNLLGDHKINVYGFGEWVGTPLSGGAPRGSSKD